AGCGLEESVSGTQAPFGRGLWTRASRLKRIGAWTNFNILEELARRVPEIPGQVRASGRGTDSKSAVTSRVCWGEQDFALVYGKGHRLKAVRLLGDQVGRPPRLRPPRRLPLRGAVPRLSPGAHRSPSSRAGRVVTRQM